MVENFFIELLKLGKVIAEKGTFMFLNEYFIFLPVRTFLKLRETLIKKLGKEVADNILKEIGKYQVAQAIKRYSKTIGFEKLDKAKINEFGIKVMNLMGHGVYEIVSFNEEENEIVIKSDNVPTALEYPLIYGKSDTPIDSFLCGIWEEAYTRFLNISMHCMETKCIACGDSYCQFELKTIKQ